MFSYRSSRVYRKKRSKSKRARIYCSWMWIVIKKTVMIKYLWWFLLIRCMSCLKLLCNRKEMKKNRKIKRRKRLKKLLLKKYSSKKFSSSNNNSNSNSNSIRWAEMCRICWTRIIRSGRMISFWIICRIWILMFSSSN